MTTLDSFLESNEDELKSLAEAFAEPKSANIAGAGAALLVKVITGSSVAAGAAEKAAGRVFGQWLADTPDQRLQQAAEAFRKADRRLDALRQFAGLVEPLIRFGLQSLQSSVARVEAGQANLVATVSGRTDDLEALLGQSLRTTALLESGQNEIKQLLGQVKRLLERFPSHALAASASQGSALTTSSVAKTVFCSHRSVDKSEVRAFAEKLRAAGINAWYDEWEIVAGDDIVARMNEGLARCEVGLVFFSSKVWDGKWFDNEVSALTVLSNEDGVRLIPVLLDSAVKLPPLLRNRARRSVEHFDQIVDAIRGTARRPLLGGPMPEHRTTCFAVQLIGPSDGRIELVARIDGTEVAHVAGVPWTRTLQRSYADFLHDQGRYGVKAHGAGALALPQALRMLGDELGVLLFPAPIAAQLQRCLQAIRPGSGLEVSYEAADATLLALPFEAARVDGAVLALQPGVTVRRVVSGAQVVEQPISASPFKILVAVGAPDEGQSSNSVLDLERELQGILDAVAPAVRDGNAEVRFLEVGHPSEIREALKRDAYHVLHLSGHGGPGTIELEDETGAAVTVTAKELADELKRTGRSLPLVFLSSCHGGTASSETASMAVGLIREGIPRVLSMQARVTDRYACDLAREFYQEIAKRGEAPVASHALAAARQTLEARRQKAALGGTGAEEMTAEYATASLFGCGTEPPLVDYSLPRVPLYKPPVHAVEGPLPALTMDELIGRRAELRRVLGVLRDQPKSIQECGKKSGVVIYGMGGVGKSALAGRVVTRLKEEGWSIAVTAGRFSLVDVAHAIGMSLSEGPSSALRAQLIDPRADDAMRMRCVVSALQTQRVVLALDNFEDNLSAGGSQFVDESTMQWLRLIAAHARTGKLLITSRYPLPEFGALFEQLQLGPLSLAETRKLFLRLPAINSLGRSELEQVLRSIGGHPRMLEYLDGILRKGKARLPLVAERLQQAAQKAGVPLKTGMDGLDEGLRATVLLGARDILLDELVALADVVGDTETLLQCAVSALPITADGVAEALVDGPANSIQVRDAAARLDRLVELSLVTLRQGGGYWVHRWTAQALAARGDQAMHRERLARVAHYRLRGGTFEGFVEAARNLLEAELFDEGSKVALQLVRVLRQAHQSVTAAGLATECLSRLPQSQQGWILLADEEADSLLALGFTERALQRWRAVHLIIETRAQSEPDRADYQRNVSISYIKLGDLLMLLGQGEQARDYFERSLKIGERLARSEPDRADYQRDVSVSYGRLGDLLMSLRQGEQARDYYERSLKIGERLAQSEPGRADYLRDLSVSYERLGELLMSLGQGEQARDYYERSLKIGERLAQSEPDRADYQRDVLVSLWQMQVVTPERAEAIRAYATRILRGLVARGVHIEDFDRFKAEFGFEE